MDEPHGGVRWADRTEEGDAAPEERRGGAPGAAAAGGPAAGAAAAAGPVTGGVRIAAVEAAVAAGLAPSTTRVPEHGAAGPRHVEHAVHALRPDRDTGRGTDVHVGSPLPPPLSSPPEPHRAPVPARRGSSAPGFDAGPVDGVPGERPDSWRPEPLGGTPFRSEVGEEVGEVLAAPGAAGPGYALLDWSDPPTGQVPRVLLDDPAGDGSGEWPAVLPRGPSWREAGSDWDDDLDLSFLADPEPPRREARLADDPDDPFGFSFARLDATGAAVPPGQHVPAMALAPAPGGSPARAQAGAGAERSGSDEDAAWSLLLAQPVDGAAPAQQRAPVAGRRGGFARRRRGAGVAGGGTGLAPPRPGGRRRGGSRLHQLGSARALTAGATAGHAPAGGESRPGGAPGTPGAGANRAAAATDGATGSAARRWLVRLATGVVAGGVALAAFVAGPLPTLVLLALLATLATGELLAALRRGGFRPVAPVALAATPACLVAAYADGVVALPAVAAASVLGTWCLLLAARRRRAPAADAGVTLLAMAWVGLLAGYGAALLAPSEFPARHGLAVLVAAVLLGVGNDVGAYAAGSRLGRHRLAPAVSPGKTWEGLVGGCVLTLLLAGLVAARIHPLGVGRALVLGAVVCVLAPLGDLAESLVKRDLGLKDMGDLLPAHGGVLDRVDSLLLVLPAAYYLAVAWHLG